MQCLSYTANTSLDGFSCAYRRKPLMSLPRLTLPRRKVATRQIICSVKSIPNFLFPPRAGVLLNIVTSRRTFRQSGRYVCIMLHTRVVRCLTICTHRGRKPLHLNRFHWSWRRLEENELGLLRRPLDARLGPSTGRVKVLCRFVSQNFLRNF
jgi:hypothetical protein